MTTKLFSIFAIVFVLAGCISGVILGPEYSNKPGAAYITASASDGERVFIRPLGSTGHDYQRLQDPGIWVSGGWYMIEYHCDSPRNHPNKLVIDEDGEEDSINITAGHSYNLQCDSDAPFVLHIFDQGELTSQRWNSGGGDHRVLRKSSQRLLTSSV